MIGSELVQTLNEPEDWAAALSGATLGFFVSIAQKAVTDDLTAGVYAGAGATAAMALKKIFDVQRSWMRRSRLRRQARELIAALPEDSPARAPANLELALSRDDPERLEWVVRRWMQAGQPGLLAPPTQPLA